MPEVELTDWRALDLKPGQALLVRFPRTMDQSAVQRAQVTIAEFLAQNKLNWPVLFARDDVEFMTHDA